MIINDFKLFKLNRCRRFCGVVKHDAVDVLDLVHDAVGGGGDGLRRQDRDLGGHEIRRGDGAQSDGVVVGALVAHDADAAHVGQRGKVLARALGPWAACRSPRARWRRHPARWRPSRGSHRR